MKKVFTLILLLGIEVCIAQAKSCDYKLLNDVIYTIADPKLKTGINIYEQPLVFTNQEKFFSKEFLVNYTAPVIGVDSEKVKEIIEKEDLLYLSKQATSKENWNFKEFKFNTNSYSENPDKTLNGQKQYKIAKPIFSRDKNTAYVYYYSICGFMDCSFNMVAVFKKIKGKWIEYLQIPVTL